MPHWECDIRLKWVKYAFLSLGLMVHPILKTVKNIIYQYLQNNGHFLTCIVAQKMKFSIKDFFSKCDQIRSFLRIWSHLLRQFLMENFIFCAVYASAKTQEREDYLNSANNRTYAYHMN